MSGNTDKPGEVHAAISAAMLEIRAFDKTERNDFHSYDYRGIDSIYNYMSRPIAAAGLHINPHSIESIEHIPGKSAKGGPQLETRMLIIYRIYARDGSFIDVPAFGIGIDSSDKGASKAQTAAYKTMMFHVFMPPLVDGSDSEKDSPERGEPEPTRRPPPQTPDLPTPPEIITARRNITHWLKSHRDAATLRPDAASDTDFLRTVSRAMYGDEGATTVARIEAMREAIDAGEYDLNTGNSKEGD